MRSSGPKFDLLIPGLFERMPEWFGSYADKPVVAQLGSLLRIADRQSVAATDYESTLWSLLDSSYSIKNELPAGRFLSEMSGQVVCRADPVHLTAGISDLMLIDQNQLNLIDDECELLSEMVNEYLAPVGGHYIYQDGIGLLAFDEAPELTSTPLSKVAGEGINEWLPTGEDKKWWHRLINEFQMLMFQSELNRLREQRGKAAISGLWLWGGGKEISTLSAEEFDNIFVTGEKLATSIFQTLNVDFAPEFPAIDSLSGKTLGIYSLLQPHSQYDDFAGWSQAIGELDRTVLAMLREALLQGQISELNIYSCHGLKFTLKPNHRWRLWRRNRSLEKYA